MIEWVIPDIVWVRLTLNAGFKEKDQDDLLSG